MASVVEGVSTADVSVSGTEGVSSVSAGDVSSAETTVVLFLEVVLGGDQFLVDRDRTSDQDGTVMVVDGSRGDNYGTWKRFRFLNVSDKGVRVMVITFKIYCSS